MDAAFDDFDDHAGSYPPPPACAGPWSKVVLRLEGSVDGVAPLAPLLADPQQVSMFIGNVVDGTYTGVIHVAVDLDFCTTGRGAPASRTADAVLPPSDTSRDGSDLVGSLTVPRNPTRLLADLFATGSGGGCEEFWDTSAAASTGYSRPTACPTARST